MKPNALLIGAVLLPASLATLHAAVGATTTIEGKVGVGTWSTQAQFDDVRVAAGTTTLFADAFTNSAGWTPAGGTWSMENGVYVQSGAGEPAYSTGPCIVTGQSSYAYTVRAMKTGGPEGFLIVFGSKDSGNYYWWNLGGWGNRSHAVARCSQGNLAYISPKADGGIESNAWQAIRVQIDNRRIRCYLNDALVHDIVDAPEGTGNSPPLDKNKLLPDANGLFFPRAPYLYDPISRDVGDPTILFHHVSGEAWVFYTQRDTMKAEGPGWYHGCDIGIQSSQFNGFSWLYRGTAEGLNAVMPGRNTFWAPEVVYHQGAYHMFVTFHIGVPLYAGPMEGRYIFDETNLKSGGIVHYTSTNLIQWQYVSRLKLEPDNGHVIDPAVHPIPDGTWRMWYRAISSAGKPILGYADSRDLFLWESKGPAVDYDGYAEGPCVFFWKGRFWMLLDGMTDKYRPAAGGLAVLKSSDATRWEFQPGGLAHDETTRNKDGRIGHCSVVLQGDRAFILYHCFTPGARGANGQLAELLVAGGKLSCVREFGRMKLESSKAPRFRGGGTPEFQAPKDGG